jgi:O-antigen biosynthesis protein
LADPRPRGRLTRAALGRLIWLAERATPRLERRYARLPASAGLAPGVDAHEQEQLLTRYFTELQSCNPALQPEFDVLIAADRPDPGWLAEAVGSVGLQTYPRWRVQLVGAPDEVLRRLPAQLTGDPRVHVAGGATGDAADLLNVALSAATGDYVVVLGQHDRLPPQALAEVIRALNVEVELTGRQPDILYSDERPIDEQGDPKGPPLFKPGWSPHLLLTGDYVGDLTVIRRELVESVGGWRAGTAPAHAFDLLLRASEATPSPVAQVAQVLYQRRTTDHVPAAAGTPDRCSSVAAVESALVRRGRSGRVVAGPAGHCAVEPELAEPAPRVSIVIPTRDRGDLLRACVRSVLDLTTYDHYEIVIVDNGTTDPAAVLALSELGRDTRVRVIGVPGAFSFARLCNAGVAAADGRFVCLLNNDTEVIGPGWLTELVGLASLPDVGAVGGQLRYPDGRIQHAGLIGLAEQGTGHAFVAMSPDATSPLGLVGRVHEVIAVTGACMAFERVKYQSVGGLDEGLAPNDSGDVDLCLRMRARGWSVLYQPAALLMHRESQSRGLSFRSFERQYLLRKWPAVLLNDPYVNPNLRKDARLDVDQRFPSADIPGPLFARWLGQGSLGLDVPPRQ